MESDLEVHENSEEVNKDTPSFLPASKDMSRTKTTGKAKKKPSKSTALQQEYDKKIQGLQDNFDSKFDTLFSMMQSLANVRGANNESIVQNRDTQGMPRSETNPDSRGQNRETQGLLRSDTLRPIIPLVSNLDEDLGSPRISRNIDFDARSEISIHVNPIERDILGDIRSDNESDNESEIRFEQSTGSVARKGERFMKHVQLKSVSNDVNKDVELSSDNITRHNVLSELFSEDIASNNDKGSVGLIMDQAQVTILENSWRCQHPEKLSAYREEYRSCFPVHDSAVEFLQVPSLDDLLEPMMRKNHGPKAVKSWDTGHRQLYTQPLKQIEKLSYQGQMASRMNVISGMYMQQTMGTLLGKLENSPSLEHEEKESCCQIVKDLFSMSTKSLDQSGRTGAFFHLVRRKAASHESGLVNLSDIKDKTQYLPLSGEGVFGNGLKTCLEKRKEQKDQLNDLLPELGQGRKRRADFDRDWQNKTPKFNVEHNIVNANKTRGSNNNRFNVPKTSNSGRQPQRDNQGYKGPAKESNKDKTNKAGQSSWGVFSDPQKEQQLTQR
ncbi:unnamed protein product [Mytilus edulis]|uniref:Uncharacterized protein n=1 Tax=Mytilus edulis TaxID=6550 RepID=A0A8S3VBA6_MYTED|nr:unnamed protein product [Mytilus edulis]